MGPQRTQIPPPPGAPETASPTTGSDLNDNSLTETLATLRKRPWVLILALILGLAYGLYQAFTQPKMYDSACVIQVRNGSSNEYKLDPTGFNSDSGTKMNTEVAILKSATLMATVAREMNLANNPDFFGSTTPMGHMSMDNPAVRQLVVTMLMSNLSVTLYPKTELIKITYSSPNAKLSADIINQVVSDYIQRSYESRFASTQRVSQWLSGQLDALKGQVELSQEQMMELERKLGVLSFDSKQNELTASLEGLLTASGTAKFNRIVAESRYRMLAGMDPNSIDDSIETTPGTLPGALTAMRSQRIALETTYAQQQDKGPNNQLMKNLKAQIDELTKQITAEQNRLQTQSRETYLAAKAVEDNVERELEAKKADAYKQRDDLVEYTLRQREFEQNRTLYEGLQQRLQTAGVQAGLESLEVDVVDRALPAVGPTMESKATIVLTRTLFFLVGGIVLAFILESLDSGLRNIAEIERVMELPSLAIIPRAKRATPDQTVAMSTAQRNINVLTQPKSQFTEAFRSLRTSLLLSTAGHAPKFILFTSATPSEGQDHHGEQSRLRPRPARYACAVDRRRSSPPQRSPSFRTHRKGRPYHRPRGNRNAGRICAACGRNSKPRYPAKRPPSPRFRPRC